MAPFMSSSLPLVTTALLSSSAPSNRPPCRRLEVCTSPGCVADGALGTLAKLRALAPPPPPPSSSDDASDDDSMSNGGATIIVKEGRCASACGSGPVVMETNGPIDRNEDGSDASTTADVRVVHKWIRDEALVKLLEGGGGGDDGGDGASISEDLIRGYDLYEQANDQVKLKRRHTAETAGLYQEAIDSAAEIVLSSMIALSDAEFTLPPNVEWVVDCYRQLATSKLAVFDRDGALEAAQRACEITRKDDVASLEVMAEVRKVRGDGDEELEALRRIFELDEQSGSENEMPRDVALRRREQGFRLASLEKSLGN